MHLFHPSQISHNRSNSNSTDLKNSELNITVSSDTKIQKYFYLNKNVIKAELI